MNTLYNESEAFTADALYDQILKRSHGVDWKLSVKAFKLKGFANAIKMEKQISNGHWKNGKPKKIIIGFPKKREGLSIKFKDRVYQGSINDNILYPSVSKSLIYSNSACQVGKGQAFARKLVKKYLHRHFINYGRNGWVVQIDIHNYYGSIKHSLANEKFKKYVSPRIHAKIVQILSDQYTDDVGYYPGSQMVQILGIMYLNEIDHFIKDVLGVKTYIRYQDDFFALFHYKKEATEFLNKVASLIEFEGLTVNEKKTKIVRLKDGFTFLGFKYTLTKTGKILMFIKPSNVKHERNKLYHLVKLSKNGHLSKESVDESYNDWKTYAQTGNSYKLIKRMDEYYNNLWKE